MNNIINNMPRVSVRGISKTDPITLYTKFTEQEKFEIDNACAIMVAVNAIVEDRLMKLADMIKGSEDAEKREKYKIKRNYHRFKAKQVVKQIYNVCQEYDRGFNNMLASAAREYDADVVTNQMRSLDMLDFSDEYLKNDFLNVRSVIRKEAKKVADVEDLTMVGHLVEALALSGIAKVIYSHLTTITPVMYEIMRFDFMNARHFWNVSKMACCDVDIRFNKGTKADISDILVSESMKNAIVDLKSKLYSLDFLNKLMEARDGVNPHFEDFVNEDALVNGYNKINIIIDPEINNPEPKNKMVI